MPNDWLSALATVLAGAAAVVAAVATIRQSRKDVNNQIEALGQSARFNNYLKFGDRWDSAEMRHNRRQLSNFLLLRPVGANGDVSLDDAIITANRGIIVKVIDFFEDLGAALKYEAVHREMVENGFSDVIATYWRCVGSNYSKLMNQAKTEVEKRTGAGPYYEQFRALNEIMCTKYPELVSNESCRDALADELALTTENSYLFGPRTAVESQNA